MGEPKYLYRYESYKEASVDEWESVTIHGPYLRLDKYPIVKETPGGYWIQYRIFGDDPDKFVKKTDSRSKKRFAYATVEEAAKSFKRRKEVQISLLQKQIEDSTRALRLIEDKLNGNS